MIADPVSTRPIIVLSYNRPQYLEPVLRSLRAQSIPIDSGQITLFQDGYRSKTGRDLTDPRLIQRCIEVFEATFPGGRVAASTENLGVAWNFARAERYVFEEVGADAAYFFEDDLVLSQHYLTTLAALTELALKDRRVAYVAAYGDHRATLAEQRLSPARLMLMRHKWGFGTTRCQWEAQREIMEPYLDIVRRTDYLARDNRAIRNYFRTLGYGSTGSSQDAMKDVASCVLGTTKIMTFACFARYIGEVGIHSRKQTYDEEGFANTDIYPEAITSFAPPSDQQLDDWISYTRRNARRVLEADTSPVPALIDASETPARAVTAVDQSTAHCPIDGTRGPETKYARWYPVKIACEGLALAQEQLRTGTVVPSRVKRLEKLFLGRDKNNLHIAEFGIWQGRTSVDFVKFLGGGGELHLFDFADNVKTVTGMMQAAGYNNVFGHGCSYKYLDSYNWSLKQLMEARPELRFDYVYLDGAHTWAIDGFTFLLCDLLLNDGGYIEFDDYDWSLSGSSLNPAKVPVIGQQYTDEQISCKQVQAIIDVLVRRKGDYSEIEKNRLFQKGTASHDTTRPSAAVATSVSETRDVIQGEAPAALPTQQLISSMCRGSGEAVREAPDRSKEGRGNMECAELDSEAQEEAEAAKATMRPTAADVHWCYRHILARAAESDDIVGQHLSRNQDFGSLVLSFINAPEFRGRNAHHRVVPLEHASLDIEWNASADQIRCLTERVKEAWTHLGFTRPYHSVLSGPDYLPQNLDERKEARFWESGKAEAGVIKSILARHRFVDPKGKMCVEYGCGLGRVTICLAELFQKVHAYDISSTHLTRAEEHAREKHVGNIEFHVCGAASEKIELEKCDFFYSRLVMQHNPPPLMREALKAALASLRSGGIAVFQLPTHAPGYRFRIQEYLSRKPSLDMEMHCLPQSLVFQIIRDSGCEVLETREDGSIGRIGQWISSTFVVRKL